MAPSVPIYNLPVYTKSGCYVGRVVEVEVDPTTHYVYYYHVTSAVGILLPHLWRRRLLIAPSQVLNITIGRMIISDNYMDRLPAVTPRLVPEVAA